MIEKTFNTGFLSLNYAEGGSSQQPPLLLLHGLTSNWQSFVNIIPALEKNWRIYSLDLRGHGQSDRAGSYRIQDVVVDIVSFLKNCIKESAVVFGHSFGGMIALYNLS